MKAPGGRSPDARSLLAMKASDDGPGGARSAIKPTTSFVTSQWSPELRNLLSNATTALSLVDLGPHVN